MAASVQVVRSENGGKTMANCKDCLHIGVCYMVEHYGVDETEELDCRQFQATLIPKVRWILREDGYHCSRCDIQAVYTGVKLNYCPNCGAKMEV